ncbi:hypothetical protein JL721_9096 [Aureococcus anophagefferens]|nr:hypothetical protein JL721_9096 [Aureococcus anophagefferens]
MVLLFLVGLLSRRLERVNANVSRLLKATIMNGARPPTRGAACRRRRRRARTPAAPRRPCPSPRARARQRPRDHAEEDASSEPRSLSADDFASLQYMLGDEDGVNM